MVDKPGFNRAWDEWIDRVAAPVRGGFRAVLDGARLIEFVATADA